MERLKKVVVEGARSWCIEALDDGFCEISFEQALLDFGGLFLQPIGKLASGDYM